MDFKLSKEAKEKLDFMASLTEDLGLEEINTREVCLSLLEREIQFNKQNRIISSQEDELNRLQGMDSYLKNMTSYLNNLLTKLQDFSSINSPDTVETINLKNKEYTKRTSTINPFEEELRMEEFIKHIEHVKEIGNVMEELEEWKDIYNGLPPNLQEAKQIVEKEQEKLDESLYKRNLMLEKNRQHRTNKK